MNSWQGSIAQDRIFPITYTPLRTLYGNANKNESSSLPKIYSSISLMLLNRHRSTCLPAGCAKDSNVYFLHPANLYQNDEVKENFRSICRTDDLLYLLTNFLNGKHKKSRGLYWLLFLISVVAFFGLYQVIGGVCILVLPFTCTWFCKGIKYNVKST